MDIPATLPGVTERMVETPRLKQHVYFSGPEDGIPVIFLHGNFSAGLAWEETMQALPAGFRGIAPDLRGFGWTENVVLDARRGSGDWVDDLQSLMEVLGISRAHFVAWSMGGLPLYRTIADHPAKVRSATLGSPLSPYGFGGTKGPDGVPCHDDFAGTGGGVLPPAFVQRIQMGDRSTDDQNSPRNFMNAFFWKQGFRYAREEVCLTAILTAKLGPDRCPGDMTPSANWPNVAPGNWGPGNSMSPKYLRQVVPDLLAAAPKPPIVWIHGDSDIVVGDLSMFDSAALGKLGYVPGWPGDEVFPPQPMVSQIRAVLEQYAAGGGAFQEYVIADCGHSPPIEKPAEFNRLFHGLLARS